MTYHYHGHPIKINPYQQPKIEILTSNFQDMIIGVNLDHLGNLPSPGLTLPHLAYHKHGHPFITNTYNLAKNLHINLKLSRYDYRGYLVPFKKPNLTWFNLTSFCNNLTWPLSDNYRTTLKLRQKYRCRPDQSTTRGIY